jgi:hypothetical protein
MLSISTLVRPASALLPLFLPLILPRTWDLKHKAMIWLTYVVASVLVVLPWTYHNYRTYNTFFPLSVKYAAVWMGSPEFYHLMKKKPNALLRIWGEELNPERNGGHNPLTIEGDRYFTNRGIASIKAEPSIYVWYSLQKLVFFWVGHPAAEWDWPFNFDLLRTKYPGWYIANILGFRLLLVIAAIGGMFVLRKRIRDFIPLLFICSYFMLVCALLLPEARYSEPLYPILAVIIASAVSDLGNYYHLGCVKKT